MTMYLKCAASESIAHDSLHIVEVSQDDHKSPILFFRLM